MTVYEAGSSAGAAVQSQRAVVAVQYGPLIAFLVLAGLILWTKGKA